MKGGEHLSRKKKPQTLEKLYNEQKKMLCNDISKLTQNVRIHCLCIRGAMLETFLPHPELLEDDEIMSLLKAIFYTDQVERSVEKPVAESEARELLTE